MNQQQPANTYRLPAISDAALLRLLEKVSRANPSGQRPISVQMLGRSIEALSSIEQLRERYPTTDWESTRHLSSATVPFSEGAIFWFARSVTQFDGSNQRKEADAWHSEAWLTWGNPIPSEQVFLQIATALDELKGPTSVSPLDPAAPKSVINVFSEQLSELTELHNKIVREAEEARLKREDEFANRRQTMEAEAATYRAEITAEVRDAKKLLDEREEQLNKRAAEIDDRGHMHARRDLRIKITNDLNLRLQRPGISKETGRLRIFIFIGGFILAVALGTFGAFSAIELQSAITGGTAGANFLTYALLARVFLSISAFVGISLWLLSWARTLHDDDLRADRDLERYRYDLDRASWVIETIMEAQSNAEHQQAAVPEEWVKGVTHGLFARAAQREDHHSAVDALASMLNFAAEAEIGPGGPRFKFTKQGARQLSKRATKELNE
jgi:hypothetical protein